MKKKQSKQVSLNALEIKRETIAVLGGGVNQLQQEAGLARTTTGCFTKEAMCYSATSGYCYPSDNCA